MQFEPGVYDLSIEQYHNESPGISRSALMEFKKSPLHYWDKYLNPNKPIQEKPEIITVRDPLGFGNALHTYILEPREFDRRYRLMPKISRATKAGKELYEDLRSDLNGRELICEEAIAELEGMRSSVVNDPFASGLITDGLYEHSIYWIDKDTGILCKVRPDIWHSNMIVDLKTTSDAEYRSFQRSVFSYGYHIQCGMIYEALRSIGHNITRYFFIAVEKTRPYAVGIYELDEVALERGISDFKELLFRLKDCMDKNHWPGYERSTIGLPAYY